MPAAPVIRNVSDTAHWTAALRALESERRRPLFRDPFARRLAGERGFAIVRTIRRPAVRIGVVLRTAAIDRFVLARVAAGCDLVLDLATGLDARPWRLDLPAELRWVDVDLPAVIDHKLAVLAGETPRCRYEAVPLDLASREQRAALFAQLGAEARRVLVVSEGLLSYLEPAVVADLARDLHEPPAMAEWLTELTGPQVAKRVQNAGAKHRPDDVRTRFAPAENSAFFLPYGWREAEYLDLFMDPAVLRDGGRPGIMPRLVRRLPARGRSWFERSLGVVRLERT